MVYADLFAGYFPLNGVARTMQCMAPELVTEPATPTISELLATTYKTAVFAFVSDLNGLGVRAGTGDYQSNQCVYPISVFVITA